MTFTIGTAEMQNCTAPASRRLGLAVARKQILLTVRREITSMMSADRLALVEQETARKPPR